MAGREEGTKHSLAGLLDTFYPWAWIVHVTFQVLAIYPLGHFSALLMTTLDYRPLRI